MEEPTELSNYLPLSYKSPKEQEYIAFLWDVFETNYAHGKYQFAFLAYHMLTMSFVYCNIWQIRQTRPGDFEKGLIGFGKDIEKNLLGATSPFVFSTVNERSILRMLKLIACDNGKIGTYTKLVDDRNETAHANGNIFFSTHAALDAKITEILRVVDEIQTHSRPVIEHAYREFLLQNHNPRIVAENLDGFGALSCLFFFPTTLSLSFSSTMVLASVPGNRVLFWPSCPSPPDRVRVAENRISLATECKNILKSHIRLAHKH